MVQRFIKWIKKERTVMVFQIYSSSSFFQVNCTAKPIYWNVWNSIVANNQVLVASCYFLE